MAARSWTGAACVVLFAFAAFVGATRAGPPVWPQSLGDISADASVTFGVLPNGMRYAIRHNATPAGQVSVRFVILAGSMQEADDQHGLAHFVEHMAFHGSTHVPDGDVKARLERMGLRFGPDANAETGPDATIYRFDLPENDAASLDTALTFSREIASELTLDPKLMDAERGVILSEAHTRAGPLQDMRHAMLVDRIGVHPYARLTIGTDAEIQSGKTSRLRDFYDAYYRPERAVLIVVGDIDPAMIEAKVRAAFSDWRGRGLGGGDPAPVTTAPGGPEVQVETVPGAPGSGLILFWNQPYSGPDLTRAALQRHISLGVAQRATAGRMHEQTDEAGRPVQIANGPHSLDIPGVARATELDALTISDPRGAVALLVKAERQFIAYGLTQGELDRAITSLRADLQAQVLGADTRRTPELAQELQETAISGSVFRSPSEKLATFNATVGDLTLDRANALLREDLASSEPRLLFYGPAPPAGGQAALTNALAQANGAAITAWVDQPVKAWAHTTFGPPGRVVEQRDDEASGSVFVRFANRVRLIVKPTTFAKDQVLVSVRFGHGQLDLPRDHVGPSDYGWLLLWSGGFTDLKSRDVAKTLAGRTVGWTVSMRDDAFEITNATPGRVTRSEELPLQMQLIAAVLTAPGWRADDWPMWMASATTLERAAGADPERLYEREALPLLHSGDLRWAPSTAAMRATWKASDIEPFMRPILVSSPLEVTIVGDVTVADAVAATAATLGALPSRRDRPEPKGLRAVRFPPPTPAPVVLRHRGPAQEALVVVNWPTTDALQDTRQTQAARVLADVMRSRLFDEIRVKHGWSYSPGAYADLSTVLPGYGMISVRVTSTPADVPAVLTTIDAVAADLAAKPISADELTRAVGPRVEAAKRAQVSNTVWLNALAAAQRDPRGLTLSMHSVSDLQSLTVDDIRAAAKRWLVQAKSWRAEVLPEAQRLAVRALDAAP